MWSVVLLQALQEMSRRKFEDSMLHHVIGAEASMPSQDCKQLLYPRQAVVLGTFPFSFLGQSDCHALLCLRMFNDVFSRSASCQERCSLLKRGTVWQASAPVTKASFCNPRFLYILVALSEVSL